MADITMCTSEMCPYKGTCYRIQAEESKLRGWYNFEYTCNEHSGFCDYIPTLKEKN